MNSASVTDPKGYVPTDPKGYVRQLGDVLGLILNNNQHTDPKGYVRQLVVLRLILNNNQHTDSTQKGTFVNG